MMFDNMQKYLRSFDSTADNTFIPFPPDTPVWGSVRMCVIPDEYLIRLHTDNARLMAFVRDVQESGGQATTDDECVTTLKRMVLEASQLLDKLKTPLPTDKG